MPTAPESLPTAMPVAGPAQPLDVAAHLQRPQRELHAERRRLGVDAVRAPDHRRVAVLVRLRRDRRVELDRGLDEQVGGTRELQRERGVDDVARRQPVVHPGALGLADALLHHVDERGDVVLGDQLARLDRRDVEAGRARAPRPAAAVGTTPSSAQASVARISTSSHAPNLASSVNRSAISGRE